MSLNQWPAGESPSRSLMPARTPLIPYYRHLFLWVLQGWLAMFYVGASVAKLSQPPEILSHLLQWPALVDWGVVQLTGWVELAFAVGVLTPLASWSMFRPVLLVSAAGLLCDALAMGAYHAIVGDGGLAVVNGVLAALAVLVLIGRGFSADRTESRR